MQCKDVQDKIAAAIDGELTPESETTFHAHLADCAECAEDYAIVVEGAEALRDLPAELPDEGLADSIFAAMIREGADPTPVPVVAPAATTSRAWKLAWFATAALAVIAALLAFEFGRRSNDEEIRSLKNSVATQDGLQEQLASREREAERLDSRVVELEGKLKSQSGLLSQLGEIRTSLDKQREDDSQAIAHERKRREETETKLEELLSTVKSQNERIANLSEELQAASIAKNDASPSDRERVPVVSPVERSNAGRLGAQIRPQDSEASVEFRRRGAELSIVVSGPLEGVVPELFKWARNEADTQTADLALGALENLLAAYIDPASTTDDADTEETVGFFGRLAERVGLDDLEDHYEPSNDVDTRRKRLETLRDAWKRFQAKAKAQRTRI